MNFTNEMIAKAGKAASAEELIEMAKAEGVELTAEEAEQYFKFLHGSRELTDEELDQVAGGKGDDPKPKFTVGQHLWLGYFTTQNYLEVTVYAPEFYIEGDGWRYLVQVPPEYGGFLQNEYLETRKYVHTTNPGPGWHD